ncbi:MAG: hypothetical protein NVSMB27_35890 [Ktedonobacteraceae bacterium]
MVHVCHMHVLLLPGTLVVATVVDYITSTIKTFLVVTRKTSNQRFVKALHSICQDERGYSKMGQRLLAYQSS